MFSSWSQVDVLEDGNSVNAETFNKPIGQLASRTDYLKRRLGSILENGVQSSLILPDVDISKDVEYSPDVGNVVFYDNDNQEFRKAQAKMSLYDDFKAADSAFTVGILIRKTDGIGDVLIYGKLNIGGDSAFKKDKMFKTGESFRSGRYYLSATEPGKLTANPSGPLIYVGSFYSNGDDSGDFTAASVAYVNPQFLDIGTSHVHRAYSLVARPAGHVENNRVIGYLPVGAVPNNREVTCPSMIFGGTWTSTSDVNYNFSLSENGAWGDVKLRWYKNGDSSKYKEVEIPAPGVYVDLDNGLTVKMLFPEADNTHAYTDLPEDMRTWETLEFPYAGKGWVDHSVDAIASGPEPELNPGEVSPVVKTLISGSWPDNDNAVMVLFPGKIQNKTFTDEDSSVEINGTVYQFVTPGTDVSAGVVPVKKAATVEETLFNLAKTYNSGFDSALAFVLGDTLVVCDSEMTGTGVTTHQGVPADGFGIVGGTIPAMVVYDSSYGLLGAPVYNQQTYTPIKQGDLNITVYAEGATTDHPGVCMIGTRLSAAAYDYSPDAIYDYAMGLHQEVDYYFPPVPAQAAGLFVNGVEMESYDLFPSNPTYKIGAKTLHWMEDEAGKLPWSDSVSDHDDVIDPSNDKTMTFYFVVGFQCSTGPVTSLVPAPGSAVKLYTHGTNDAAYTGDLMIDVALDMSVSDAGVSGYNVAKEGKGGKLLAGPVVERIKAGNGIVISQPKGCPLGQGTVTIGLDDGTMKGQFSEIALENAKQEKIGLFPYVSLLGWSNSSSIPSAFTAMMRVPSGLENKKYQLQVKAVMFGTVSYSNAARQSAAGVQFEYNILPDFTDKTHKSLKSGLMIPDTPRTVAIPLGHKVGTSWEYVAYDPFVVTTDTTVEEESDVIVPAFNGPIPQLSEFTGKIPDLRPGYLVSVRISRTGNPDSGYSSYTGPLGFLSFEWALEEI